MARREFDLNTLLDIPLWETVQDQIAALTGTAIITIDIRGNPITKHSCRTEFCSVIRENPVSRKRCLRCDALAGLEAVRLGKPFIYLCHCGIVDVAVPVMVGDKYLGAVMFGQVRIPNDDTDAKIERLVNEISSFQAEEETARQDLLEMYERLPEMEYQRIVEIADLIDAFMKYIVDRAVKNRNDMQTYDWFLKTSKDLQEPLDSEIKQIVEVVDGSSSGVSDRDIVPASSAVYPAVQYLRYHTKDNVTMKEMAQLCHLSTSYFSRIFNREVGEPFVSFVNRRKIELSKEMLRETNHSVTHISSELGYANISHFIELFKRYEGVTPVVYRQHKYK